MEDPKYWLRASDVLLHSPGIEVAAFPVLYPRHCFGDTNIKEKGLLGPKSEASIFTSHLRKLLSSNTAYILKPEIAFLLYDIAMANRLTTVIHVAEKRGFSAEVMSDHYTDSESYWRHEQEISCDMVRQMAAKCDLSPETPEDQRVYDYCREGIEKQRQ